MKHALLQATRLNSDRWGIFLTGVNPLLFARDMHIERYSKQCATSRAKQEPLHADCLDEPATEAKVNMLEVLDPITAFFYSEESRVVDWAGKS